MSEITIRDNPGRSRFEVIDRDKVIGQAAYIDDNENNQRIFYHTVIREEYRGQGHAGRLAELALNQTVAADLLIIPVCPYITKYLGKHPEYAENARTPTPAILQFLDEALARRHRG